MMYEEVRCFQCLSSWEHRLLSRLEEVALSVVVGRNWAGGRGPVDVVVGADAWLQSSIIRWLALTQ